MTIVTNAREECTCGCVCCADEPRTTRDEIEQLRHLRESVERRLSELEGSNAG